MGQRMDVDIFLGFSWKHLTEIFSSRIPTFDIGDYLSMWIYDSCALGNLSNLGLDFYIS